MVPELVAVSVPSVDVDVTVRTKSASESAAGVICKPYRSPSDNVQVVTPSTVLDVPVFKVAPSGTPSMTMLVMLSESSVTAVMMFRLIALSSRPETSATFSVGASASGSTETAMVPTVEAVSPPSASVEVAVTVRSKSASESLAGVTCKAVISQPDMSALALPSPVNVFVPSVSTAPSGTPLMLMDRLSDPSVSVRPDAMSGRSIAVSSVPLAVVPMVSVGASASAATETVMLPVELAEVPSSDEVAVTLRSKSTSESAGGVTVRLSRFQPVTSTEPPPAGAV